MAKTCPKCRQQNSTEAKTCIACGWELGLPEPPTAPPNPPEAGHPDPGLGPGRSAATAHPAGPASGGADSDSEKLLWAGRASYLANLHQWVLYLLACAAVLVLFFWVRAKADPERWCLGLLMLLVWIVILPPGIWLAAKTLYLRRSVGYRLTEQRLFVDHGLIGRITDQTELFRVDDVRVRQGPIQRMLGLGDVIILSSDVTDRELVIRGIKDPTAVAEHVRTQMRTLRKQRTLYVDSV